VSDHVSAGSFAQQPTNPQGLAARLRQGWRQGQRPSLAELLAEQAPVSPAELAALVRVDQHERWRVGERPLVEDYLRQHPALAEDEELALGALYGELLIRQELGEEPSLEEYQRRFPHLAGTLEQYFGPEKAPIEPPRPEVPGYEVLEKLGEGGMGVVYKARQLGLGRLVALKMVGGGASGEHLARFQAESRALARVAHPNIVQIFEVGTNVGLRYFAMELLDTSLDRLLKGNPQPVRASAQLLATLAEAVHAAHLAGVVHRDLKPANVLLSCPGGGAGPAATALDGVVPKVSDFGLAKLLAAGPGATAPDGLTRSGAILGTPCYLAPEQAEGKARDVGPAADVHALGAILYELLTGRPPFVGATVLETIEQVRRQEPVPPTRFRAEVPRDLETICLACLRKEPQQRYPSAAHLAEDLRCFLQGKPVRARPTPSWERGLKWARRRPAVAGLTAALVCALLGLFVLGGWSYLRIRASVDDLTAKNQELEAARAGEALKAEEARRAEESAKRKAKEARRNWDFAWEAVHRFYIKVVGQELLNEPHMEELRASLLSLALSFHERFVQEAGDDPKLQEQRGRAYLQYGQITAKSGNGRAALARFDRGRAIFADLAGRQPERAEHRANLASALAEIADLRAQIGQFVEAEKAHREAIAHQEALVKNGGDANHKHGLALSQLNLGILLEDTGRRKEAEAAYRSALALLRPVRKDYPKWPRARREQATTLSRLANLLMQQRRFHEADSPSAEGLAVARALHKADVRSVRYRLTLGWAELGRANLYLNTRRLKEADKGYEQGQGVFEKLVNEHPGLVESKKGLATACLNRGHGHVASGRPEKAEKAFRAAAEHFGALHEKGPQLTEPILGLGASHASLADLLHRKGARAEALERFDRARAVLEKGVGKQGRYAPAVAMLGGVSAQRARILTELGRHAEAVRSWQESLRLAGANAPPDWHAGLACALARAGRPGAAAAEAQKLLKREALPAGIVYDLACAFALCAAADPTEESYARRAQEALERARVAGFFRTAANRELLRKDADLAFLREREEHKRWLEKVAP
jgi:serine/threonine protein kinase/tetratricopeptide (TPR) repeat protein